jgi:hypothetical protein
VARTKSLEVLHRQIRELQAKAEEMERAEKPGIKQLRALLKKYKLGPADVKIVLNGSVRTSPLFISDPLAPVRTSSVVPSYRHASRNIRRSDDLKHFADTFMRPDAISPDRTLASK